ncbi:uncharacterized protein A1O9_13146 [Exophiala aquamarina CBS 119918]|uniref:CSC1/OSCA1-like 7TM region domain-containing protein n=1 Tax=Exophiala aquamarina CBS 119918 TaxID=1182545 RepID=A0A072NUW7_9EURO|nr:uncharacterized protein A1O9_13146 [Exophiala aquamarina CBS 119918]KEF50803.1 hypothetical protein A1O9_13146 [Exophiala aquamarina CBS 119918]
MPLAWIGGRGPRDGVNGLDRLAWPNVRVDAHGRHWAFCLGSTCLLAILWFLVDRDLHEAAWIRQWDRIGSANRQLHLVLVENLPAGYRDASSLGTWYRQQLGDVLEGVYVIEDATELARHMADAKETGEKERRLSQRIARSRTGPPGEDCDAKGVIVQAHQSLLRLKGSPSALIQFKDGRIAWYVAHTVSWPQAGHMRPHLLDGSVDDLVFENLGPSWEAAGSSSAVGSVVIAASMALCAPLISMTGTLSQLDSVARLVPHGQVILAWPSWLKGLVQGVAPQLAVTCILGIFPHVLRAIVRRQRRPTALEVELAVDKWYYDFLFVFLVLNVSISVAVTTLLAQVADNVRSIPFILAENLPKAATYFSSYVVTSTLLACGRDLSQQISLLRYAVGRLWSPRWTSPSPTLDSLQWGFVYPRVEIVACIVIVYGPSSPLILPLAFLSCALMSLSYRYLLLYVVRVEVETEGKLYLLAIRHLLFAMGVQQVYCLGLFSLNAVDTGSPHSFVQAAIVAVSGLVTFLLDRHVRRQFSPLFVYKPWSGMTVGCIHDRAGQEQARRAEKIVREARATLALRACAVDVEH